MDLKQTKALLSEIENKFPVQEWKVDDVLIWPFLRVNIVSRLSMDEFSSDSIPKKKVYKVLWQKLSFLIRSSFHNYGIRNKSIIKKDVIFLDDGISQSCLGGKRFLTIIDPIRIFLEGKGLNSTVLSLGYSHPKNSIVPIVLIQGLIDLVSIKNKLGKNGAHKHKMDLAGYDEFMIFWERKGVPIPVWSVPELLHYSRLIHSLVSLYSKKLLKIKPKYVFINCFYNLTNMSFIHACSLLDIKTFDIQHGVAGNMNPFYSSWENIPLNGYSSLPDCFLSWEESDEVAINKWSSGLSKHKAKYIGNLFLDCFKHPNVTNINIVNYLNLNIDDYRLKKNKVAILITLSWGMDLTKEYDEIFKFVKSKQSKYLFFIRLHPVMIGREKEIEKMLLESFDITEFEIDKATKIPLYFLLPQMDIHLTYASATCVEAMHLGVPSVIASNYGYENLHDSVSAKYRRTALTSRDIEDAVSELLANKELNLEYEDLEVRRRNLNNLIG